MKAGLRGGLAIMSVLLATVAQASPGGAEVRVAQLGYATGTPQRAYLMSASHGVAASFHIVAADGGTVASGSTRLTARRWGRWWVQPLDFSLAKAGTYRIVIDSPIAAESPGFPVAAPAQLYGAALARGLSFYRNQRDGPNYVPSPLRVAPAHLNDTSAEIYATPQFDSDDNLIGPLLPEGDVIDASGGWADAGDYLKFVVTHSYTVAMMEVGARDFPSLLGVGSTADFASEAAFGLSWLAKMWDDGSQRLYYQVGIGSVSANVYGDHDLWRLPQADDTDGGTDPAYQYIRNRPVFAAAAAGAAVSPNLAGRLAADFALGYQLQRVSDPALAAQYLLAAEHVFALADTAPATLLTAAPYDFYPETEWRDDLELGATELAIALRAAPPPPGLPVSDPEVYLTAAAHWANAYIAADDSDTLNLYDVSGLAHFELIRAMRQAAMPGGLETTPAALLADLARQLAGARRTAARDPFGFGFPWGEYDSVTHGAGLAVMASEQAYLAGQASKSAEARQWSGNILGANAWGVSFIVGDGSRFPNCMQHQVANLAGALDGTSPILDGALVEGPNRLPTVGRLDGMLACPAAGGNPYTAFDGSAAVYRDTVESYSTNEPAIDLTSASILMFAWLAGGSPQPLPGS